MNLLSFSKFPLLWIQPSLNQSNHPHCNYWTLSLWEIVGCHRTVSFPSHMWYYRSSALTTYQYVSIFDSSGFWTCLKCLHPQAFYSSLSPLHRFLTSSWTLEDSSKLTQLIFGFSSESYNVISVFDSSFRFQQFIHSSSLILQLFPSTAFFILFVALLFLFLGKQSWSHRSVSICNSRAWYDALQLTECWQVAVVFPFWRWFRLSIFIFSGGWDWSYWRNLVWRQCPFCFPSQLVFGKPTTDQRHHWLFLWCSSELKSWKYSCRYSILLKLSI